MSIQSEAERIKANVAAQEALIAQISAVLDGKAGGGTSEPVEEKDVNFWDYDGTLLYSYTLAEAQALTELPAGPDWHDELIFDSWNWTLDQVKALTYDMDIGALYNTVDGATHLVLDVDEYELDTTLYFTQDTAQTVIVDWGDGTPAEAPATSGAIVLQHTYPQAGEYTIRIHASKNYCRLGISDGSTTVLGTSIRDDYRTTKLKAVRMGAHTLMYKYAFACMCHMELFSCPNNTADRYIAQEAMRVSSNLQHMNLPNSNTAAATGALRGTGCRIISFGGKTSHVITQAVRDAAALRRLLVPSAAVWSEGYHCYNNRAMRKTRGWTYSGNNGSFAYSNALEEFVFDLASTGIGNQQFYCCYSLKSLEIPAAVTTIGSQAFGSCTGMRRLRFLPATPPTVANANAFTGIPTDCIVEVPATSLEAYQNATNYSGIAAQMIGV